MKLFILKTDIKSQLQFNKLRPVFQQNDCIARWTVDLDDVDRVLKLETRIDLKQEEMIKMIRDQGIKCEELPD